MKIFLHVFVINLVFIASAFAQPEITQKIAQKVAEEMQAIAERYAQKVAETSRIYKQRSQLSITASERQAALNEHQKILQQLNLSFQQKIAELKQKLINKYKETLLQNHY